MVSLGQLAFAAPWVLVALAILPALWWLLKVTPPALRRVRFPAARLLMNLRQREETPARTPPWLMILRLALAGLLILALAHPLLNPGAKLAGSGPLVLVVDDGWAAARNWPARQRVMADFIDQAARAARPVVLLPTAPPASGEAVRPGRLLPAADALSAVQALEPQPWPVDRRAAMAALDGLDLEGSANVVWLSDGLDDGMAYALAERLQHLGSLRVILDPPAARARLLLPPEREGADFVVRAVRPFAGDEDLIWLQARAEDGRVLAREPIRFAAGAGVGEARLVLPAEARNRLSRLHIEGEASAGAVILLDERWRRRPVGLVSGGSLETAQPLLGETFYLERALTPYSEVRHGTVAELIERELAMLILADVGTLTDADGQALKAWAAAGGVIVRFAGPRFTQGVDDLVPVRLRLGDRSFGGAMSWTKPAKLAPFDKPSPFAGLTVPDEVTVERQVLAEPALDLGAKTWARLVDGTPLVTGERRGKGWLILVHTTANADWSNLALSGLFVDMLRRMVALSQGVVGGGEALLPPFETLDGFGQPHKPPPTAVAIVANAATGIAVGPRHPPGFYGNETTRRALNLQATVRELTPIERLPTGVVRAAYTDSREVDLKPWLLAAVVIIALADLIAGLALRGFIPLRRTSAAALALAVIASGAQSFAQTREQGDDAFALKATLDTRLAYVVTGVAQVDEVSRAGLTGLGAVLARRTSVELAEPLAVDVARDELAFFPLLYWPVTLGQRALPPHTIGKLNDYLRTGGMILFDTRDSAPGMSGGLSGRSEGTRHLRRIVSGLSIPPLSPVPEDHVLTRSFYLISTFPGRWAGGTVWVESREGRINDGVSSVIIGGNDWAGAWAIDESGRPLFAVVPGGEAQREAAFRFGVNLVMYALTGNYKADQVHLPTILERLGY
jgi:hypothetical protein